MRRPTPNKAAKPLRKPDYFPAENILTRTLPESLAGQQEFEQYHFISFDLTQANLSGWTFRDCLFENCNLAGASISNVALQNVAFMGCKLLGLQFQACRTMLFGVHFEKCQLDYASFWGRAMPNTRFADCSLREANFTQADLTGVAFENCQLRDAVFSQTRLLGVDFTTAHDIALDPEVNDLKQARFSLRSLPGLLTKHQLIIQE